MSNMIDDCHNLPNGGCIPGMDRYVHFGGSIFVYEIRQKWPPELASSTNLGTKLDMLFEIAKSVEIVIILRNTAILL